MTLLIILSWITVILVIAVLLGIWWNDHRQRQLREHKKVEISELAMIFQTLRDVVAEQKLMAKEFNEYVEKKIAEIRAVASDAHSQLQSVRVSISELSKKINLIQEEIDRLGLQANLLKRQGGEENVLDLQPSLREAELLSETLRSHVQPMEESTLSRVTESLTLDEGRVRESGGETHGESVVEDGEDHGNEESEVESEVSRRSVQEEFEQVRNAYLTLIRGEDAGATPKAGGSEAVSLEPTRPESSSTLTPVQKLVLEYHEAGLTLNEIAKELGMGKGEVRLILSLALAKKNRETK